MSFFYGISDLAFLAIAAIFSGLTIEVYAEEGFFSLNITVLAIGLGVFGLILSIADIVFYVIACTRKLNLISCRMVSRVPVILYLLGKGGRLIL